MAYAPRTQSRITQKASSIATTRQKLRDNTERLQGPDVSGSAAMSNYNTATRTGENTPLKITTCSPSTNPPATQYDDVLETGVKYHYPDQFERTVDRSDRVNAWNSVQENLNAPDATKESQVVEGFMKGPNVYRYTEEDNRMISMGGQVNPTTKLPSFSDGNKV